MTLLIRRKKDKGPSKFGSIEATKEASMPMIGPDRDKKLLEAATVLINKGSLSMTRSEEGKKDDDASKCRNTCGASIP
jgi:hypothetical protein